MTPKKQPFGTPENYFESVDAKIWQRINKQKPYKIKPLKWGQIAAMLALFSSIGLFYFYNNSQATPQVYFYEEMATQLSDNDLLEVEQQLEISTELSLYYLQNF